MCFPEARKLEEKELEGAKNKPREKKSSKKQRRERKGALQEPPSHDSSALSSDYELPKSPWESRKTSQRAREELSWEPKWSSETLKRAPQKPSKA